MIIERYDGHGALEPGARRTIQHNSATLRFEIVATMEHAAPESWTVEVSLFGQRILAPKESFESEQLAGAAAEAMLRKRLVKVLAV